MAADAVQNSNNTQHMSALSPLSVLHFDLCSASWGLWGGSHCQPTTAHIGRGSWLCRTGIFVSKSSQEMRPRSSLPRLALRRDARIAHLREFRRSLQILRPRVLRTEASWFIAVFPCRFWSISDVWIKTISVASLYFKCNFPKHWRMRQKRATLSHSTILFVCVCMLYVHF